MNEKLVAGVDFSGAKEVPNETWLAVGKLGALGLEIMELSKVGSHALAQELNNNKALTAIGIDCPFSLPIEFLGYMARQHQKKDYQSWQELAEDLVFTSFEDFLAMVKDYKKEPKRLTDTTGGSPAQSPLHRVNPSMVQMTYQGIRLLASLDPARFFVLPFQKPIPLGTKVIEVYPRDTLRFFGLPDCGYKGREKKEAEKVEELRRKIMQGAVEIREKKGLKFKDYARLVVNKRFENMAVASDHALDAIIACYTTALYIEDPSRFEDPFASDQLEVLLEGWIYRVR